MVNIQTITDPESPTIYEIGKTLRGDFRGGAFTAVWLANLS